VIAAYSELALPPPSLEHLQVPTLLLLGDRSWLVLEEDVDALGAALGDLLEIVRVPGGHTIFWDAFDETADALEEFLSRHFTARHD
jgi:pimeloyl-ACP methyl ester carboxylesterase